MIGVDRVASSVLFHSRFSPSGDHLVTSPFSREMPFHSGPRQCGQSSGSISDCSDALIPCPAEPTDAAATKELVAKSKVVRRKRVHRLVFMEDSCTFRMLTWLGKTEQDGL